MLTLRAGEVKTAAFRQTEHTVTGWAFNAVVGESGGLVLVLLVLLLPEPELLTGETLMLRRPW